MRGDAEVVYTRYVQVAAVSGVEHKRIIRSIRVDLVEERVGLMLSGGGVYEVQNAELKIYFILVKIQVTR